MDMHFRIVMVAAIVSCWGCSPPVPVVPDTVVFPTGRGRIEVRKKLGDITGGIGDHRYRIHTTLVYVKEDGSDVLLEVQGQSYHRGRSSTTVALRDNADSNARRVFGPEPRDVYVDSKIVDSRPSQRHRAAIPRRGASRRRTTGDTPATPEPSF